MRILALGVLLAGCSAATAPASQPQVNPTVAAVTTSASPSASVNSQPRRSVTISGSGDILIHPSLWGHAQADGLTFEPALDGARASVRRADYAICHVEQGFNDAAGPITEYPNYYTHPVLAQGIAATGFDACSTASNWTWLKGLDGIARTNRALQKAGVSVAGSRAKPDQDISTVEQVNGVSVAHLSYTDPSESSGIPGADYAINRGTPAQIVEAARQARVDGADLVVVSLAMGPMGSSSTTAEQREAVRTLARSGDIDLVIGHGAHVIQGAQRIAGTWVVWHGNLLSSFFPDQRRMHEGLISHTTFTETENGQFEATRIKGDIVLSLPQSGRLIDISRQRCTSVPARWQEAYDATRDVMMPAIQQGFRLSRPCSSRP